MFPVSFIHIRKAGGTAIKSMLRGDDRFVLHQHNMTLPKLWRDNPETAVFFVVRDPVSRFVSGFNSRLREGAPAHARKWLPQEAEAFEHFHTPNELAEALSSEGKWRRAAARLAMHSINHVRHPLTVWLGDTAFLERHKAQLLFIGLLARLNDDMPVMRERLGLESSLILPDEAAVAHRAPSTDSTAISETARDNILEWYADDVPLFEWCLAFREEMGLRND